MLCIGHRGAMGHEPENTLRSLHKALELGVDAIEIDVYNVEDHLVVIHDRDLSSTTNGTGYIEKCSFAYLRSLDAGKEEQVPTLEEVFNTIDRQVFINIELKGKNTANLVVDLIFKYIEQGWSYEDFIISSFNHYELSLVKAIDPQIKVGMLIYGLPWDYLGIAQKLAADIVIVNQNYIDLELVNKVQEQDLQVWVYTVDLPQDMITMRELGVDAIFTNYPDIFTLIMS